MSDEDSGFKTTVARGLLAPANLVAVLGAVFILLGVAGGVTFNRWFPIPGNGWRGFIVTVGLVLIALNFVLRNKAAPKLSQKQVKGLGVTIDHPQQNAVIEGRTDVRGRIEKPLPEGYELRILRGYPEGGFAPDRPCFFPDHNSWEAKQFDIGGALRDHRRIEAWLVGPDGRVLLDEWIAALQVHVTTNNRVRELAANEPLRWFKPIKGKTSDMFLCASINVTKG